MMKFNVAILFLFFYAVSCSNSDSTNKLEEKEEIVETPDTPTEEPEVTWKTIPVPANAGEGNVWEFQDMSDSFDYEAEAANKGAEFNAKWTDFYHNQWSGPGLTEWKRDHSLVKDGYLLMVASRVPNSNKIHLGCITSKEQVIYLCI